jgi:hypothetical protein
MLRECGRLDQVNLGPLVHGLRDALLIPVCSNRLLHLSAIKATRPSGDGSERYVQVIDSTLRLSRQSKHWLKVKNRKHPAMSRVIEAFG